MSAMATVSAIDVLRRECTAAALMDRNAVGGVRFVTVDVGLVGKEGLERGGNAVELVDSWSASERAAYGPAFLAAQHNHAAIPRTPVDQSVFIDTLLDVISEGRLGNASTLSRALGIVDLRNWIRGSRFSIGAGGS